MEIEFSEPRKVELELSSLSFPGIYLENASNIFIDGLRMVEVEEDLEEYIGQPVYCMDKGHSYGIIKLKSCKKKNDEGKVLFEYDLEVVDRFEDSKPVVPPNSRMVYETKFLSQKREDEDIDYIIDSLEEELKQKTFKPPISAKNNAQKVLDWKRKYGNEVKGMTSTGWARARQLASGKPVGMETVSAMARFNRHRKNATIDPKFKSTPWKDNGRVAWLGWGGSSGVNWAIGILNGIKGGKKNG